MVAYGRNNDGKVRTGRGVLAGVSLACGVCVLMLTPAALAQASGTDQPVDAPSVRTNADSAPAPAAESERPDASPDGAEAVGASGETEGVAVSDYMTVDIFVQDEDLATVLQMLSMQSQRNIVASRDVVATVSANLYGVTFYEALDAILHVNGYGYVEKGNFIYVYPAEVIQQMQAEQRRIVSKVIRLDYLNANDAAEFVAPLLSPDVGQIKTNGDVGGFQLTDKTPQGAEEFALSSTLVIYDYPENVEEIEELLRQLDTQPAQVLVEATILQMRLSEDNAFGVDFSVISDLDFTDFAGLGGPLGIVDSLLGKNEGTAFTPPDNSATGIQSTPGNTAGPATLKVGVINDDFSVFVRVLDQVSDTTVLSSPKVLTLNRQPARVLVGRKLGYLSTTTTETSTSQTVEFLDTGTQLAFRPFISTDGMIRMELAPSVSEGFIRENKDATGAAVTIPDEVTQEVTTNVMVRDGSTVVLGGLFREETSLQRSQVPILGDIPLVGAAFRGHEDNIDRSEIIFLIKPTIMNEQVMADDAMRAYDYMEKVRTGSRQGLLPWSRERQTAQLNVQAQEYARAGDMDRAMWALRRSLELNPVQPDALELRERLFDLSDDWPSRSMFQYILDGGEENHFDEWSDYDEDEAEAGATQAPPAPEQAQGEAPWGGWFGKPMGAPAEPTGVASQGDATEVGTRDVQDVEPAFAPERETVAQDQPWNGDEPISHEEIAQEQGAGWEQGVEQEGAGQEQGRAPARLTRRQAWQTPRPTEDAPAPSAEEVEAFGRNSWPWLVMPFQTATTERPTPEMAGAEQAAEPAQETTPIEGADFVETTGSEEDEADGAVANAEDPDEE